MVSIEEVRFMNGDTTVSCWLSGLTVIQVARHRLQVAGMFPILSGDTVVRALHSRHSKQTPLMSSMPTMILRSMVMKPVVGRIVQPYYPRLPK